MPATALGQTWNAQQYAQQGRFVADLAGGVFELLAPQPGERILDLGCGDGVLTAKIAATGAEVVGADSSPSMVEAAQALHLDARLIAADALPFEREFDAVFSNAALHWMRNQDAVLGRSAPRPQTGRPLRRRDGRPRQHCRYPRGAFGGGKPMGIRSRGARTQLLPHALEICPAP